MTETQHTLEGSERLNIEPMVVPSDPDVVEPQIAGTGLTDEESAWLLKNDDVDDDNPASPAPSVILPGAEEIAQSEPDPAAETPSEEVPVEPEETPQATEVDTDELETALKALRLSGMPQTALDSLSQEEIVSYGLKQAQRNKDVDAKLRDAADTRKELDGLKEAAADADTTAAEERRAPTPVADISDVVQSLSDQLGYGDDAQVKEALETFGKTLAGQFQTTLTKMQEENQLLRDQVTQVQGTAVEERLDQARVELTERYPQLSDGKVWSDVVERGNRLAKGGGYEGPSRFTALVGDAAMLVLGAPEAKPDHSVRNESRNSGQPSKPTQIPPSSSMTRGEREDAILDALEGGGENRLDVARRLAGTT